MIEYGHIIVKRPFKMSFIPSLQNIKKIGSPSEIIDCVSDVYSLRQYEFLNGIENPTLDLINYTKKAAGKSALRSALVVLNSCCNKDPSKLIGHFKENGRYVAGIESIENIIELAKILLKNGVIGKSQRKSTNTTSKKSNEFDAISYINIARVHLELNIEEAKNLTMTELIMLMESKHPDQEEKEPSTLNMTKAEYKEKMAKARSINKKIAAQRSTKNG